jgi:hypothetical protein
MPARFSEQVRRFREEGAEQLARLQDWLDSGEEGPAGFAEAEQRAWETLLARFFPAEECGRTHLSLFACPGQSAPQLFAETFSPEELDSSGHREGNQ